MLLGLCKEHRTFFQTLKENEFLYLLLLEWSKLLPKIYESVGDRLRGFGEDLSKEQLQLRLLFNAGGAFNVIIHWIEEGMEMTPEDMAAQLEDWLV